MPTNTPQPQPDRRPDTPEIHLGVVAAPGTAFALAERALPGLQTALDDGSPGVVWRLHLVEDGLVQPPATDHDLVTAARDRLLEDGWDLVVCFTDLPLREGRRATVAHVSTVESVALLSVPMLGVRESGRRTQRVVLQVVDALLGRDDDDTDEEWATQRAERLQSLGTDVREGNPVQFTARVLTGNLSLLLGMVRMNRPWRLALELSGALVGAFTAGVFALITGDIWLIADTSGIGRLVTIMLAAVALIVASVIIGAKLWERSPHRHARQQIVLFNMATSLTVTIGVLTFYVALFVLALVAALLLLSPDTLRSALGHDVDWTSYARIAWFTTSLATVGGALGAGLESDDAVRSAAYARRSDTSEDAGTPTD